MIDARARYRAAARRLRNTVLEFTLRCHAYSEVITLSTIDDGDRLCTR